MTTGIVSLVIVGRAQGQVLERVLMPGPVIEGHAEYEDQCNSCHQPFSRDLQRDLCIDCHTEIAEDLDTESGFHGLSPTIANIECATCHTEHEGRDANIVGLDLDAFEHGATDFPLLDSHRAVRCDDCHAPEVAFRETASTCFSCHDDVDPHKGNLGEACGDCHAETRWADAVFDHDTTDFALIARHAELSCAGCHRNELYVDTPTQCVDCHRVDDVHVGANGDTCHSCHSPSAWADASFNHLSETGFGLEGGHGGLACEACHEGSKFEQPLDPTCHACHRADDIHAGNHGDQCDGCHAPTRWPDVSFDHGLDTTFALRGAHSELVCTACHKGPVEAALPDSTCNGCHWNDDVHQAQLGENCATCHGETGWTADVRFDHDLTSFPLLGLHAAISCEACHASPAFHDAGSQCVDCHREDDVHESRLGPECATCHNPNDWLIWQFDHDAQTDFALDGAHAGLECLSCHQRAVGTTAAVALSSACGSCHRGDDIHSGSFGTDCARCHTAESFMELKEL